jgi:hypothetical protein
MNATGAVTLGRFLGPSPAPRLLRSLAGELVDLVSVHIEDDATSPSVAVIDDDLRRLLSCISLPVRSDTKMVFLAIGRASLFSFGSPAELIAVHSRYDRQK